MIKVKGDSIMMWLIISGLLIAVAAGVLYREFGNYVRDVSPDNFIAKGEKEDGNH